MSTYKDHTASEPRELQSTVVIFCNFIVFPLFISQSFINWCSRFSCNVIVTFLENAALWKNRVLETICSIGIKDLEVESSDSPSRM
jgi:hypothetical protein